MKTKTKHRPRQRAQKPRAGGKWGDGVRERLRALVGEKGPNQYGFATTLDVDPARVTEWVSGATLPSAESLRAIAETFQVSVDWLLLGVDSGGAPSTSPVYHGQRRPTAALHHDLTAWVRRELLAHARLSDLGLSWWGIKAQNIQVDAEQLLGLVRESAKAELERDAKRRGAAGWLRQLEQSLELEEKALPFVERTHARLGSDEQKRVEAYEAAVRWKHARLDEARREASQPRGPIWVASFDGDAR